MEEKGSTTPPGDKRAYLIEIVTAIVLGLGTTGAAYAAYQASLYDGNSLDAYTEGLLKSSEASKKTLEAQNNFTYDMITWMEWQGHIVASEKLSGKDAEVQQALADSIASDFIEERLKLAMEWSDKESAKQGKFVSPLESEDYAIELFAEAFEAEDGMKKTIETARKANGTGDEYTLLTVLFTISLFFAGIATVFKRDTVKLGLLGAGTALLIFTAIKLFGLPAA